MILRAAALWMLLTHAVGPSVDRVEEGVASAVRDVSDELPVAGPATEAPPEGSAPPLPQDARGFQVKPRTSAEQGATWLPRVALYPVNVLLKAVFWPVRKVLRGGKSNFVPYARRAFFWNRAGTLGWLPHVSYLSDFGLTYGARVFHTNLLGSGERIQAKVLAGGLFAQRYQLRFDADHLKDTRVWMDTRLRYETNPVLIFRGLGQPDATPAQPLVPVGPRGQDVFTRYSQDRLLAYLRLGYAFGRRTREFKPGIEVIHNHRTTGPRNDPHRTLLGSDTDQPSIEERYDITQLTGFGVTTDITAIHGVLDLDFRNAQGRPSRGFFFSFLGGGAPPQRGYQYGHYGAEFTKFVNLYKDTRILVLRLGLEALHASDADIPFTELAILGGPYRLRGFPVGRFRDKRAALGTVEYRFPIHQMLQGHLFVDAGRVASNYQQLLDAGPRDWNWGVGGGFTARTVRRLWLKVDMAYGEGFWWALSLDPLQAFLRRSKQL